MLVGVALVTIAAFVLGAGMAVSGAVSPAVAAHVVFAVGIVPLILAAITHFVPVLTRTGASGGAIHRLPVLAQVAGVLAVLAMHGSLPRSVLHAAASVDVLAAASLALWVRGRARACLGKPHPGWRWYFVALLLLALALLSVPVMLALPVAHGALRLLHLHLNTLGVIGLAAFGTLPVLLPTALNQPDQGAASWLARRLPWLAGGALLAAAAAALSVTALDFLVPPLATVAAVLLAVPVLLLLRQWQGRFGGYALMGDGAATPLLAAVFGWLLLTVAGLGHAFGLWAGRPGIAAFVGAFLLPLVTGALTQLLPVWRYRGVVTPERTALRERLAASGRWRAGFFLGAGLALLAGEEVAGGVLVLAGLLLFARGLVVGLRR